MKTLTVLVLIAAAAYAESYFTASADLAVIVFKSDDSIYGPHGKLLMDKSGKLYVTQHEFVSNLKRVLASRSGSISQSSTGSNGSNIIGTGNVTIVNGQRQ